MNTYKCAYEEATIDALTNMTRVVQQSNRFREFKKTLHCTGQHIMVITIAKAIQVQI